MQLLQLNEVDQVTVAVDLAAELRRYSKSALIRMTNTAMLFPSQINVE